MKRIFTTSLLIIVAIITFAQKTQVPVTYYGKCVSGMVMKPECSPVDNIKTDVINEDFNTWPPVNWTIVNGSTSVGNQHWHSEGTTDKYAAVQYDNGDGVIHDQDEWLISPEFTVPVNAFLNFVYHSNPYWMVDPNENADVNVKVSTDGGTTWTALWNENDTDFEYSVWTEEFVDLGDYVGQNVKIAFQYIGTDACWFYIDNVVVYGLPEFDLEITDARINFFEIFDYHEDASDFHYSSHYQKIPIEVLQDNEYAYLAFNAIVINKGYGTGVVQCNVKVTDPEGNEIYDMTSDNDFAIGEMGVDTIDIAYDEGTEFLLENPIPGVYTVEYSIFMNGQIIIFDPHYIPGNSKEILTKTLTFEVDNSVFARDANNVDDYIGPQYWDGGGNDGDILTVRYPLFDDALITSVMTYIHPDSDPGNMLLCNIYQYDASAEEYVSIATSPLKIIEEEDLGTWVSFTFPDPAYIVADEEYTLTPVLVGFEFYYAEGESYLWLGCDKTVPSSAWGTLWYMVGGSTSNQWYAITNFDGVPMIRMNLFSETGVETVNEISATNIFPNPATDMLNLTGITGDKVEILDNCGRCLDTFECTGDAMNIDLKNYNAGYYFLRFSGDDCATTVNRFSVIR
jgi:hypothetical protein